MPAFPPRSLSLPRPGPRVFFRTIPVVDVPNDLTGIVARATASAVAPAVTIAVAPASSASTASQPVPNVGEGIVPGAAGATASSTVPVVEIAVAPAASTSTATMPVPNYGEGVVPAASLATASSTAPAVTLEVTPGAASATATAPVPVVSGPVAAAGGWPNRFARSTFTLPLEPPKAKRRNVTLTAPAAAALARMPVPTLAVVPPDDSILAAAGVKATRAWTADEAEEIAVVRMLLTL